MSRSSGEPIVDRELRQLNTGCFCRFGSDTHFRCINQYLRCLAGSIAVCVFTNGQPSKVMPKSESDSLAAAATISRRIASARGPEFLTELVCSLGEALRADYCSVGEIFETDGGSRVRTVALAVDGAPHSGAPIEYALEGTPCADVTKAGCACAWSHDVQESFPRDTLLVDMGVHAYAGVPLHDGAGRPRGLLTALFQDTAARSPGRLPSARDLRGLGGERTRAATTRSPSRASRSSVRALTERDLHHRRAIQAVHRREPRCPSEPWLFDGTAASNDTA